MKLTKEQRIARHKDFVSANWGLLAAFSWENYLAKGKGAVLVPEEDFIHAESPQYKGLRFHYLPLNDRDKEPFKGILAEKELDWLKTYDPDEKVVVCVMRDKGISSYFIGGRMKPSECYAKQQAKHN